MMHFVCLQSHLFFFFILLLLILYCTVHILQHERVYSRYVCVYDYILKNLYKKKGEEWGGGLPSPPPPLLADGKVDNPKKNKKQAPLLYPFTIFISL